MARLDLEEFENQEVTRVYLAGELKEAKRVESALTEHGINYAVDIERYRKLILGIVPMEYPGAAFFVASAHAEFARKALLAAGLVAGIGDDNNP